MVDGWQCVVKKGEFKVGSEALYFEIDSFLPMSNPLFEFLRKNAVTWQGTLGARIRTVKLRGQISQGLLIPVPAAIKDRFFSIKDLDSYFDVVKWERDVPELDTRKDSWYVSFIRCVTPKKYRAYVFKVLFPKLTRDKVKRAGSFPNFLVKTDEERIQNVISSKFGVDAEYEVTCKMDGSSMTVYVKDGVFGHCSRNVKLGIEDGSNFSKVVKKYDLHTLLPEVCGIRNIAIQGELCGPTIQSNYEGLDEYDLFVFRVFDIDSRRYFSPDERDEFLNSIKDKLPLKKVPSIGIINTSGLTIEDYLILAEGPSLKVNKREGVVFQRLDGGDSFKCVSNSYLLKVKE